MTSDRKKRARCALCDTTESPSGWYNWNNRPTVKFCEVCWSGGASGWKNVSARKRRWFFLWLR